MPEKGRDYTQEAPVGAKGDGNPGGQPVRRAFKRGPCPKAGGYNPQR